VPPKREYDGANDTPKGKGIVPAQTFSQVKVDENREDRQRDDLLDDLERVCGEFPVADAIGRNLEAVFGERDKPANHHDQR